MPWTSNESVSLPAFTVALGLLTVSIFSKWPRWSFFEPVPILRSILRSILHRPLWAELEFESRVSLAHVSLSFLPPRSPTVYQHHLSSTAIPSISAIPSATVIPSSTAILEDSMR